MSGDTSGYDADHSRAGMALCIMLAQRYGCNAFKIDEQFRESGLYREKWERQDYRESNITKAILAVARDEAIFGMRQTRSKMTLRPTSSLTTPRRAKTAIFRSEK